MPRQRGGHPVMGFPALVIHVLGFSPRALFMAAGPGAPSRHHRPSVLIGGKPARDLGAAGPREHHVVSLTSRASRKQRSWGLLGVDGLSCGVQGSWTRCRRRPQAQSRCRNLQWQWPSMKPVRCARPASYTGPAAPRSRQTFPPARIFPSLPPHSRGDHRPSHSVGPLVRMRIMIFRLFDKSSHYIFRKFM
jgi:hypothetical protein